MITDHIIKNIINLVSSFVFDKKKKTKTEFFLKQYRLSNLFQLEQESMKLTFGVCVRNYDFLEVVRG